MKKPILRFIVIALALSTVVTWIKIYRTFHQPFLYRKDFIQFYLMSKALESGSSVYLPVADLAHEFDPNLGNYHQHPSAYPPTIVFLVLPLAKLSYTHALLLWDCFEVFCFVIAATLVFRHLRSRNSVDRLALVIVFCVLWPPFSYDLHHGQVMMTILLLLTATWLSLSTGRQKLAGVFLGVLFAIKLYAWPIALFLLLKRNFRPVVWAIGLFLLLNSIIALWLGLGTITQYYLTVAPEISRLYRTHASNFSLFAMGYSLAGSWFGYVLVLVVLAFSLVLAFKAPDFDHAFMIMAAATIILSPVSWNHYLLTLLPALCLIASWTEVQIQEKVLIAFLFFLAVPNAYDLFLPQPVLRWMSVLFVLGLILLLTRQLRKQSVATVALQS